MLFFILTKLLKVNVNEKAIKHTHGKSIAARKEYCAIVINEIFDSFWNGI